MLREERLIMQPLGDERMDQREQHRRVGIRSNRNPCRAGRLRSVIADWTDVDDLDTGAAKLLHPTADRMRPAAALRDMHVLRIGAAEQNHKPAVTRDRGPRRERPRHRLRGAENMRQECERGAEAVVRRLIDEAAESTEKAADLPAGLVENPRRAPALRAAHDRAVAVIASDSIKLTRNEVEHARPVDRHERFATAARAVSGPLREPTFADHGLSDASLGMDGVRNGVEQRRWIGIVLKRCDADDVSVSHLRLKGAEVRMVANEFA